MVIKRKAFSSVDTIKYETVEFWSKAIKERFKTEQEVIDEALEFINTNTIISITDSIARYGYASCREIIVYYKANHEN